MDKVEQFQNYDTLTFGARINKCIEEIQEKMGINLYVPPNGGERIGVDSIGIGKMSVTNFPGDCGAIIARGMSSADETTLKAIEKYASISGFSNIFGTLVTDSTTVRDHYMKMYQDLGWVVINVSMSNRNSDKHSVSLYKFVECEHKGY